MPQQQRRPQRLGRWKDVVITLLVVAVGGVALYRSVLLPWHVRWGATPAEVSAKLPGDDLVRQPRVLSTRAITIQAPPQAVWPWLVQVGQGRGGLYSYDWLENLAGCDIHSADRIVPDWQHPSLGDPVRLAPAGGNGPPPFTIRRIEPEHALVLVNGEGGDLTSWAFVVQDAPNRTSRLLVRYRQHFAPTAGNTLMWRGIIQPIHFAMERRMLLGIRDRAEARKP